MSEPATPESGPLSVDQAIASLLPPVEEEQAQEAPVEAAEGELEPEGASSAPEEAAEGAENPEDGAEEPVEEAATPLDPPLYWKPEAKEAFASLDPALQAEILAQEGPREESTAKAKAEAAAKVSAAEAEMAKVTQLAEGLADILPRALQKFVSDWGVEPDWVAFAAEHGGELMAVRKAEYDADLRDLQALTTAQARAAEQAHETYVKAEFAKLTEIAPDLADPEKGPANRQATVKYMTAHGIDPADIKNISAAELTMAHKARLYDEAQAALKARPTPKPASAPAQRSPVRPAAAPAQPSSRSAAQAAQSRFNLNPSAENAAALLLAKG